MDNQQPPAFGPNGNGKEPSASFHGIVCRATTCSERTNLLAKEFSNAVADSERFAWMALVERVDDLNRLRMAVYLLDRPDPQPRRRTSVSVGQAFEVLALALRPALFLDLYFLDGATLSIDQARAMLTQRYSAEAAGGTFVWESTVMPTVAVAV